MNGSSFDTAGGLCAHAALLSLNTDKVAASPASSRNSIRPITPERARPQGKPWAGRKGALLESVALQ
jgi:hypothetical protein